MTRCKMPPEMGFSVSLQARTAFADRSTRAHPVGYRDPMSSEPCSMRSLLENAAQRAICSLEEVQERAVAPAGIAALSELDRALPAVPTAPENVIELLDRYVSPATMGMAGPRFFGFVFGGALPVTIAANWLGGAWDQNTGLFFSTPGVSRLEEIALKWMIELFGFPPETGAGFVTGATMANLSGLAAARNRLYQ